METDSVGLEATQEGNIGWGFLIRIYSYIFFLSGCDLRSCFFQWTGLFQIQDMLSTHKGHDPILRQVAANQAEVPELNLPNVTSL